MMNRSIKLRIFVGFFCTLGDERTDKQNEGEQKRDTYRATRESDTT